MKKTFKVFVLFLIAASALVSCSKELDVALKDKPVAGEKTVLTIKATNPESVATKTTMSGTTPSWLAGDMITVIYKTTSDAVATAESTPLAANNATATFKATLTGANTSIKGYAVYPANGLAQSLTEAKVPIAAEQHPTGTAFDGTSDIMVSEAFTPAGTVSTRFARLGAILRVKINNATLSSEKILSLSVTGANNLVGDARVNLSDASLAGLDNGSKTVTATYAPANQFTVDAADKYVYLIVYPQELAASSTLTISGETENTTFSKDIVLPNKIVLNPGHIVPLNVTISSFTPKNYYLLFEETFGGIDSSLNTNSGSLTSDNAGWTYIKEQATGAGEHSARFGTSSAKGSAQTPSINIPELYRGQNLKLSFKAAAWNGNSEQTTLSVSATGAGITLSGDGLSEGKVTTVKNSWTTYELNIGTTSSSSSVTIKFEGVATSNARFFLDDVKVYYPVVKKEIKTMAFASSSIDVNKDDSVTLPALTIEDNSDNDISGDVSVTFTSSDTSIAEEYSGEVLGYKPGHITLTASVTGDAVYEDKSATLDVYVLGDLPAPTGVTLTTLSKTALVASWTAAVGAESYSWALINTSTEAIAKSGTTTDTSLDIDYSDSNVPAGTYKLSVVSTLASEHDGVNNSAAGESGTSTVNDVVTKSISIADYASANSWDSGTQYTTVTIDGNITATAGGGTNSGKYYTSNPSGWRFYDSDSGTLTISATGGHAIKSITVTFSIKDSGKICYGSSALTSGKAVSISDATSVELVIGSTSGSSGKVGISNISVTYE